MFCETYCFSSKINWRLFDLLWAWSRWVFAYVLKIEFSAQKAFAMMSALGEVGGKGTDLHLNILQSS